MAKSKSKNNFKALCLMSLLALGILIIKAYIRLPLGQNHITGRGLYFFLNNTQFIETAICTFIGVGFFCQKYIGRSVGTSLQMALGFTALNFGVMMIDARAQSYNVFVEVYIKETYGNSFIIFALAIIIIFIGFITINFASKRK
jgi:hypothetical protein